MMHNDNGKPIDTYLGICNRISIAREHAGMERKDVAEYLGVSNVAVGYWERGERGLDVDRLIQLSTLYQCSLYWLITGHYEPQIDEIKAIAERVANDLQSLALLVKLA